jgi:DNA modification methylase|nr:MAG TPA: adenine specific DNA methyltransferase [Caudoviricetes sp.]
MGKKRTAGQTPVRVAVKDLPTIRIDELIPYENNAKIHGPEQIEQLRRSLREFGFVSPVLIDEDKNLIAGHGRVEAARAEGMTEVPYVTVSDLTEAQRRAYIIADNRLAETGEWDAARLKFEMEELSTLSFDTSLTGFTMDNIPLLSGDEPAGGPEAQEDDYDGSVPEETSVRDGDLWKLGGHRLMVGSTSSKKSVERLMNGVKANMVFTDPPYGVAVGSKNKMLDDVAGGKSGRCTENIYGDTMSESELHDMLLAAMRNIREACAEDASYYVTSPQGGSLGLMMMMMMMEAGLQVRHMLIWRKSSPTFSMGRLNYDYQHEPIFYTWTKRHNWYGKGKFHTSVWDVEKPRKCDLHPTMKPVALVENALLNSSAAGDVVLDGFGGSGTTLIACEQLGRTCYMMEIDPHYAQVIIDRWEKLTGEKAELIDDDR